MAHPRRIFSADFLCSRRWGLPSFLSALIALCALQPNSVYAERTVAASTSRAKAAAASLSHPVRNLRRRSELLSRRSPRARQGHTRRPLRWKPVASTADRIAQVARSQDARRFDEVAPALESAVRTSVNHRVNRRADKTRMANSLLFSYELAVSRYPRAVAKMSQTLGPADATRILAAICELEHNARDSVLSAIEESRSRTTRGLLNAIERRVGVLTERRQVWFQNVLRFSTALGEQGFPRVAIRLHSGIETSELTLDREELEVLMHYTFTQGSSRIKQEVGRTTQSGLVRALDHALQKLPAVKADLYRRAIVPRAELDLRYREGADVIEEQFLSTSRDRTVADARFGDLPINNSDVSVRFEISGHSGRDVSGFSRYPDEREVLFPRNTKFRVVSAEKIERRTRLDPDFVVRLEEK